MKAHAPDKLLRYLRILCVMSERFWQRIECFALSEAASHLELLPLCLPKPTAAQRQTSSSCSESARILGWSGSAGGEMPWRPKSHSPSASCTAQAIGNLAGQLYLDHWPNVVKG